MNHPQHIPIPPPAPPAPPQVHRMPPAPAPFVQHFGAMNLNGAPAAQHPRVLPPQHQSFHELYRFEKYQAERPSWIVAKRIRSPNESEDNLRSTVRRWTAKRTANELLTHPTVRGSQDCKSRHAESLLRDRALLENDPGFEWKLAAVGLDGEAAPKATTTKMDVIIKRQLRKGPPMVPVLAPGTKPNPIECVIQLTREGAVALAPLGASALAYQQRAAQQYAAQQHAAQQQAAGLSHAQHANPHAQDQHIKEVKKEKTKKKHQPPIIHMITPQHSDSSSNSDIDESEMEHMTPPGSPNTIFSSSAGSTRSRKANKYYHLSHASLDGHTGSSKHGKRGSKDGKYYKDSHVHVDDRKPLDTRNLREHTRKNPSLDLGSGRDSKYDFEERIIMPNTSRQRRGDHSHRRDSSYLRSGGSDDLYHSLGSKAHRYSYSGGSTSTDGGDIFNHRRSLSYFSEPRHPVRRITPREDPYHDEIYTERQRRLEAEADARLERERAQRARDLLEDERFERERAQKARDMLVDEKFERERMGRRQSDRGFDDRDRFAFGLAGARRERGYGYYS